jgi:hypothetical protein
MSIEDVNINIDGFIQQKQIIRENPQALNYISTKKAMSTKNKINSKMQTQNVQNLLREAKKEMVTDDAIHLGSEDLTVHNIIERNQFNGTQDVAGVYNQNKGGGFSPMNKNAPEIDFHSQGTAGSSSTFGLSQINKKKQII